MQRNASRVPHDRAPIGGARHPFVGRSGELGRLAAWRAADGSSVAVIQGEAGVGKTRLLQEFLALVPPSGVVRVSGSHDVGQRPLQSITDAFGIVVAPRARPSDAGADVRFRLQEQVLDAVSVRATLGPVLIAADDAQWLDVASIELLIAATNVSDTGRVRLLLSTRPVEASDERRELFGHADVTIDLGGLDEAAVRDLVEFATGSPPSHGDLAAARAAGGNPLLTLEAVHLARSGAASDQRSEPADPLGRLRARLEDPELRAATAAAVIGRRFTVTDVAATLGWTHAAASAACAALLRHDVVVAADQRTLSFRHDLLRETFLDAATPQTLAGLHHDRAQVLAAAAGGADTVAVARHLVAAGDTSDIVPWLTAAGQALLDTDPAGAAEFFRRAMDAAAPPDVDLIVSLAQALTWSKRADEALGLLDQPELAEHPEVLRQRAQAHAARGELATAATLFEAVGAATDDATLAQRSNGEAQLLRAFAFDFDTAERHSRELLATTDVDALAAVHAGCALGWVQQHRGQIDDAVETLEDANSAAGDDPSCLWRNPAMYLLDAHISGDRFADLEELSRTARRVALDHGDIWQVPALSSMLAGAHFRTGEWDRASAEIDAGKSWADHTGNRLALPWLLSLLAVIDSRRGNLADADAALARADEVLSQETRSGAEAVAWARAWRSWAGGEPDAALRIVEELWQLMMTVGIANRITTIAPMFARLALDTGDHDRCVRLVDDLRAIDDGSRSLVGLAPVRMLVTGLLEHSPQKLATAAERFGELHLGPDRADAIVDLAALCPPATLDLYRPQVADAAEQLRTLGAAAPLDRLLACVPAGLLTLPEPSADPLGTLTHAERRIARLIATGASNPEIAEQLCISRRTVESHLSHIFTKLGIAGRVDLALLASRDEGAHSQ